MPRRAVPARAQPAPPPTLDQLARRLPRLWPAAKGSLSHVRKPCTRPDCPACKAGRRHPVWLFSGRLAGRRVCAYVPPARVATLRQALARGRRVEALLVQAALALLAQDRPPRTRRPARG